MQDRSKAEKPAAMCAAINAGNTTKPIVQGSAPAQGRELARPAPVADSEAPLPRGYPSDDLQ